MSSISDCKYINVLTAIIEKHSLLNHPFYVAWSEGALPTPAMRLYASEYGNFIETLATGWALVGEPHIAEVETKHAAIWDRSFACALGEPVRTPAVKEVSELLRITNNLFGSRAPTLGALYAFEAQQPGTVSSKLKGLQEHYSNLPASCAEYFKAHASDYDEISILESALENLSPADQTRTTAACEQMCKALYDALSGIYAHQSWS